MKSLSMGDETGDLAGPGCITARVKNRNPTVPCWLSFMSAALDTKLVASEPLPLQSSIPPPASLCFYSFILFISRYESRLRSVLLCPICLSLSFTLRCSFCHQRCALTVLSLYFIVTWISPRFSVKQQTSRNVLLLSELYVWFISIAAF